MVRTTPRSSSSGNGANPGDRAPASGAAPSGFPSGPQEDDGTDAELMVSPRVRNESSDGGGTDAQGTAPAVGPQGREPAPGARKEPSVSTDLGKIAEDVMRETEARTQADADPEETGAELLGDPEPTPSTEGEAAGKPTDHAISRHDPDLWGTSGRLESVRTKLRGAGDSPHARARGGGVDSPWLQRIRKG